MKKVNRKIVVFNEKGRVGKTPFSTELALRLGYAYATNENRPRKDIKNIIPDENFLQIDPVKKFPKLPDDFVVVFDLAGALLGFEKSILSALTQADLIIIPVINESDTISATAYTIAEIKDDPEIKAEILIIANMITSHKKGDYTKGKDFLNIKKELTKKVGNSLTILPLKFSKGFEHIFQHKLSIEDMVKGGGLARANFGSVSQQIDQIINFIKK